VIEEVIFGLALLLAVIAQDYTVKVLVLRRHGMILEHLINLLKVRVHVRQRFPADGTLIRVLDMFIVTG
jgi:hypothetical protein